MGLTRLLGGASGITNQPQGLDIGISGSNIKSKQQIRSILSATETSKAVAFSNIDITKSIIFPNILLSSCNQINYAAIQLNTFTNTSVTLTRNSTNNTNSIADVGLDIIEYNNVKSKQIITTSSSIGYPTGTDITISPVTTSKAIAHVSFSANNTVTTISSYSFGWEFTSPTNIRLYGNGLNYTITIQILEFN